MYCERLDPNLMSYFFNNSQDDASIKLNVFLNEPMCQRTLKYAQCLEKNFRLKCSQTFIQTFNKVERFNGRCSFEAKPKLRSNHNGAVNLKIDFLFSIFIQMIISFYKQF